MTPPTPSRADALAIWRAAVDAVRPDIAVRQALETGPLRDLCAAAPRVIVVGGGKAGATMAEAVETVFADRLDRLGGIVNVPAGSVKPLRAIRLHPGRPDGSNEPTAEGVRGTELMLDAVAGAGPNDVVLCLISGGGSALLPAPADGVSLDDKQRLTKLLHRSGASIHEINAVRKHLSRVKGGGLARDFRGKHLFSLILSDVVGDPVDVIASGPTVADPSTFADALGVLEKYGLTDLAPAAAVRRLRLGAAGGAPETLKEMPANVGYEIVGDNMLALMAAQAEAERRGYRVINLGPFIQGDTRALAQFQSAVVGSLLAYHQPDTPPACLLSGGETTVTLPQDHGRGGRNQEFVLAMLDALPGELELGCVVLSGGTDGEDGPTDAAGAVADDAVLRRALTTGLDPAAFLTRHDAYTFFDAVGGLLKTGLTGTNVMDVRLVLVPFLQ